MVNTLLKDFTEVIADVTFLVDVAKRVPNTFTFKARVKYIYHTQHNRCSNLKIDDNSDSYLMTCRSVT